MANNQLDELLKSFSMSLRNAIIPVLKNPHVSHRITLVGSISEIEARFLGETLGSIGVSQTLDLSRALLTSSNMDPLCEKLEEAKASHHIIFNGNFLGEGVVCLAKMIAQAELPHKIDLCNTDNSGKILDTILDGFLDASVSHEINLRNCGIGRLEINLREVLLEKIKNSSIPSIIDLSGNNLPDSFKDYLLKLIGKSQFPYFASRIKISDFEEFNRQKEINNAVEAVENPERFASKFAQSINHLKRPFKGEDPGSLLPILEGIRVTSNEEEGDEPLSRDVIDMIAKHLGNEEVNKINLQILQQAIVKSFAKNGLEISEANSNYFHIEGGKTVFNNIPEGYQDVEHDGWCFFHSVAAIHARGRYTAEELSNAVIAEILENIERYQEDIQNEVITNSNFYGYREGKNPLDLYLNYHLQHNDGGNRPWANSVVIQATVNVLQVNINVHLFGQSGLPLRYNGGVNHGQEAVILFEPSEFLATESLVIGNINNVHFVPRIEQDLSFQERTDDEYSDEDDSDLEGPSHEFGSSCSKGTFETYF